MNHIAVTVLCCTGQALSTLPVQADGGHICANEENVGCVAVATAPCATPGLASESFLASANTSYLIAVTADCTGCVPNYCAVIEYSLWRMQSVCCCSLYMSLYVHKLYPVCCSCDNVPATGLNQTLLASSTAPLFSQPAALNLSMTSAAGLCLWGVMTTLWRTSIGCYLQVPHIVPQTSMASLGCGIRWALFCMML